MNPNITKAERMEAIENFFQDMITNAIFKNATDEELYKICRAFKKLEEHVFGSWEYEGF